MSDELLHICHGRALSAVLAVPTVSFVEENQVCVFRFPDGFFNAENTLDRGAFSAHRAGIFFRDPYPSHSILLPVASGFLCPPLYCQRNSLSCNNLRVQLRPLFGSV